MVISFLDSNRPGPKIVKSPVELERHRREIGQSIEEVLRIAPGSAALSAETKAPRKVAEGYLTPVILKPEEGIILPCVWIESQTGSSKGSVVLFLHDKGKNALVEDEKIARYLLNKGFRIFAVDLRGTGETAPGMEGYFWDFLSGKPVFGQRVGDVCAALKWVLRPEIGAEEVYIWANGVSALWAAPAAALNKNVSGLILENVLISFESAVTSRLPAYNHEIILPGVLLRFDLPQVYQAIAPRKVSVINPLSGNKSPASKVVAEKAFAHVQDTYRALQSGGNWSVITGLGSRNRPELIASALEDN